MMLCSYSDNVKVWKACCAVTISQGIREPMMTGCSKGSGCELPAQAVGAVLELMFMITVGRRYTERGKASYCCGHTVHLREVHLLACFLNLGTLSPLGYLITPL